MSSTDRSLHFSHSFVISCGTVTVDINTSQVLLIRSRGSGDAYLPKGRKDINEKLEDAALRETFEETGIAATLLPTHTLSLATKPSASVDGATPSSTGTTEPIAVTQRTTNGVLKIIFWFVASGDSTTAVPADRPQQENEDYDTLWVPFEDAESTLSFDDDGRVARAGIVAATVAGGRVS